MNLRQNTLKSILTEQEQLCEKTARFLWIAFTIFLLVRATLGPMWYAEIDSNALPLISLQYRGSILMNASDLIQAQTDFPTLYAGINSYEDLRCSKLLETSAGWLAWYFPIYPIFCLPVKLVLALFQVEQERCFYITNALLISTALWFVHKKLKVTPKQRLIALILLILSPIIYYNNYLNYEAFIFSMLTISLVQYYNGRYKTSAFLLALAGMSNSTVMAVGIVMIGEHFVKMLSQERGTPFIALIKRNFKETVNYGLCFVPCLVPLIHQKIYLGQNAFLSNAFTTTNVGARFLMYLFDPTLGFSTFAPVAVLLFFVLTARALFKKDFRALSWCLFLLGTVAAFSLTVHINCGMIFCARYLVWTYPIVVLFLATVGYTAIASIVWRRALYLMLACSSSLLLLINHSTAVAGHVFNPTTSWILENTPSLYNPFSATFYCRTLHEDGAYYHTEPAYYLSPETNEVRKLIFKADPGQAELVLEDLEGDSASVTNLKERLEKIPLDGRFHYLSYPAGGDSQLYEKSIAEKEGWSDGPVIAEAKNFMLETRPSYQSFGKQITIQDETFYKIDLQLPRDFDFSAPQNFFIDFYGENYDNGEQEAGSFLVEDRYDYTFYFDSGSLGADTKTVAARIINFTQGHSPAEISQFTITEMVQTN